MTREKQERKNKVLVLILSLLLHIVILVLILTGYYLDNKNTLKKKKKKQTAPVIFKKPKTSLPKYTGTPRRQPLIAPKPPQSRPLKKESKEEQKPKQKRGKKEEKKREEPKKEEKEKKKDQKKVIKTKRKAKIKTEIKSKKEIRQKEKTTVKQAPKELEQKKIAERKKIPEKQKLSLTDFTKGFLNFTKKRGSNLVRYTNSTKGTPTEEQLKHERYVQKILSCIRTSYSIKRRSFYIQRNITRNEMISIDINILLNLNGTISDLTIVSSSGILEFDTFMLDVLKYSESSFPPVPKYFKTDKYLAPIRFYIPSNTLIR